MTLSETHAVCLSVTSQTSSHSYITLRSHSTCENKAKVGTLFFFVNHESICSHSLLTANTEHWCICTGERSYIPSGWCFYTKRQTKCLTHRWESLTSHITSHRWDSSWRFRTLTFKCSSQQDELNWKRKLKREAVNSGKLGEFLYFDQLSNKIQTCWHLTRQLSITHIHAGKEKKKKKINPRIVYYYLMIIWLFK